MKTTVYSNISGAFTAKNCLQHSPKQLKQMGTGSFKQPIISISANFSSTLELGTLSSLKASYHITAKTTQKKNRLQRFKFHPYDEENSAASSY